MYAVLTENAPSSHTQQPSPVTTAVLLPLPICCSIWLCALLHRCVYSVTRVIRGTGDFDAQEVAAALASHVPLHKIVMEAVHTDDGPVAGLQLHQPSIVDLKKAVANTKWCAEAASRGVGCFFCGPDATHNSMKCQRVNQRCFKCGSKGHSRTNCTEESRTVPRQFCCRCLLPLWSLYENGQVRH